MQRRSLTLVQPFRGLNPLAHICPSWVMIQLVPQPFPQPLTPPIPVLSQNADLFCTSSLSLLQTSPSANGGGLLRMTTGGEEVLVGVQAKASLSLQPGIIQNFRVHFSFALMRACLGARSTDLSLLFQPFTRPCLSET